MNAETVQKEKFESLIRELLTYINNTPSLLSLLYDLNWMPEQLERNSRDWCKMLTLAEAWRANSNMFASYLKDAKKMSESEDWRECDAQELILGLGELYDKLLGQAQSEIN